MSSHLETIPLDVLVHIASFTVEPAPLTRLGPLLQLLLSSRTLYHLLSIRTCPQLYAHIFRVSFDLQGYHRRTGQHAMTSSCLATELQRRRQVLRRIRLRQMIEQHILADLWVIYLMLLESDALDELHLYDAGVSKWVTNVLERYCQATNVFDDQVTSLAITVASLVWSHSDISGFRIEDRNWILSSIRPFTTRTPLYLHTNVSGVVGQQSSQSTDVPSTQASVSPNFSQGTCKCISYNGMTISAPNLSLSSIFLTFALKEVTPLQVPPHLPETRAEAIAVGNNGPTKEDFRAITRTRTQLVADSFQHNQRCGSDLDLSRERQRPSRSTIHDEDFYRITHHLDLHPHSEQLQAYLPGLLTGDWEGSYMVAPPTLCSPAAHPFGIDRDQEFLCRRPIQFRLEEYLSFTPWLPLPIEAHEGFDGYVPRNFRSDKLNFPSLQTTTVDISHGDTEKAHYYEPFHLSGVSESGRNTQHALDVVITGETPHRFQAAWGAFTFSGRVRLSDGLISLTREPQNGEDDGDGTWVFQGYLRSRRTFIGRWSTLSPADQPGVGGIFSVSKSTE
ncbi:hypothetical protein J3A83DRAFT_4087354 [Scleroderma citrinum]